MTSRPLAFVLAALIRGGGGNVGLGFEAGGGSNAGAGPGAGPGATGRDVVRLPRFWALVVAGGLAVVGWLIMAAAAVVAAAVVAAAACRSRPRCRWWSVALLAGRGRGRGEADHRRAAQFGPVPSGVPISPSGFQMRRG